MNTIILIGRLTSDPELKFFSSGTAISKCTIAIDRNYKKDNQTVTDFIPIEVWGKQAEYAATCLQKGYLIAISGSLHIDRYIDSEGNNRTFAKVMAKTISKLNVPKSSLGTLSTSTDNTQSDTNTTESYDSSILNQYCSDSSNSTQLNNSNNVNNTSNTDSNNEANLQTNSSNNTQNSGTPTAMEVDSQLAKLVEEGDEIPF